MQWRTTSARAQLIKAIGFCRLCETLFLSFCVSCLVVEASLNALFVNGGKYKLQAINSSLILSVAKIL